MSSTTSPSAGGADLILTGGNVLTCDAGFARAEAVALAGDRVLAVGTDDEIESAAASRCRRVDLGGRTVLPGLIDQHLHLDVLAGTLSPRLVDLSGPFDGMRDLARAVAEHAANRPEDRWVLGHNWREGAVEELADRTRRADRRRLDEAIPDRPVHLRHFSGHAALLNGAGLHAAGIDRSTPDPTGGEIVRDPTTGEPTGLLLESAAEMAARRLPVPSADERAAEQRAAMAHLNALGVTSVTDPRVSPDGLRDYGALRRGAHQTVRVHCLLHWGTSGTTSSSEALLDGLRACGLSTGVGDDWLRILGGKLFADGVPSQRTAWLGEPYADAADHGGLLMPGADDDERVADLERCVAALYEHRLAPQVHAIGDEACAAVVEAIAAAQRAHPWPEARPVLIHGVILRPETMRRLAELDIGVTTNALIRYFAAPTMRPTLGAARWDGSVAVRALLDAGVRVSDSSDAPVVPPDWRIGVQALVTRETAETAGEPAGADQRIERSEALRAWTSAAAYQQGAEATKGAIAPGMLADLAVLAEDPLEVPAEELHALSPVATLVGGRSVHDRDGLLA